MSHSPPPTTPSERVADSPEITSPVSIAQSAGNIVAALLSDVSEGQDRIMSPFETPPESEDEQDAFTNGTEDLSTSLDDQDVFHDLEIDLGALFQPGIRKEAIAELQVRLHDTLRKHLTPQRVMLRDKVTFTAGSLDLFVSAYWLGAFPETFHRLYTVKAIIMLALRWVYYRHTKQHYYMLDLCYWAQVILLLHLWVFPTNIVLGKAAFALSTGPLLWSILAFRNSLVYHSFDKVTSLFLHWFPACVCWAWRWHSPPALALTLSENPAMRAQWEAATFKELCGIPMVPYLIWAILYYLKVFVISQKRISERKYETLYSYATSRRGVFASVVSWFPHRWQPLAYLSLHCALTAMVMAFNVLWWANKRANTAIVMAALVLATWNGASFYFNIFAKRYVASLGLDGQKKGSGAPSVQGTPRQLTPVVDGNIPPMVSTARKMN